MKNSRLFKFMACLCFGITAHSFDVQAQQLAFPEAQGWGRFQLEDAPVAYTM